MGNVGQEEVLSPFNDVLLHCEVLLVPPYLDQDQATGLIADICLLVG